MRLVRAEQDAQTSAQERRQTRSHRRLRRPSAGRRQQARRSSVARAPGAGHGSGERAAAPQSVAGGRGGRRPEGAGRALAGGARPAAPHCCRSCSSGPSGSKSRAVTGLDGRETACRSGDAQAVLDHLKGGGDWGNWLFRACRCQEPAATCARRDGGRPSGGHARWPQDLLDHLRLSRHLDRCRGDLGRRRRAGQWAPSSCA